jgi:hypothetical protein
MGNSVVCPFVVVDVAAAVVVETTPVPLASAYITAHQASGLTMGHILMALLVVLGGQEDLQALATAHIRDHPTVTTGPALARLVAAA